MNNELSNRIKSVFPSILAAMSLEMKVEFINTAEKELYIFHFGFGTWIRNNILTEDNEIYRLFKGNGFDEKDDMSHAIINELHKYLWSRKWLLVKV